MTPDFDDLLAKAEAATPGPYRRGEIRPGVGGREIFGANGAAVGEADGLSDAAFWEAASPDVIRDLVLRLRELDRLFDLRWKADMRAIKRWRDAAPAGEDRSLTMPDRADLGVFLLERLRRAEAVIRVCADPDFGGPGGISIYAAAANELPRRQNIAAAYFTTEGGE